MADDTAKLVLSLEARFDKFEKEMKNATKVVDQQTKIIETRMAGMVNVIENKLSGIQGAFISQAGTLGAAISKLGPIGVGAAVGVGALSQSLNAVGDAAERIGQKAIDIRKFSLGTGFSIAETQGIRKALVGLGQDADDVQKAIEKFTIELNELKTTGGGPLVKALQSVDNNLVGMMIRAGSTREAFELLILAMSKMDTASRNAFARSVGGRGGIGAFGELAADFEKFKKLMDAGIFSAKSEAEITEWVKLTRELGAETKAAKANWDKLLEPAANSWINYQISLMQSLNAAWKIYNEQGLLAAIRADLAKSSIPGLAAPPPAPTERAPVRRTPIRVETPVSDRQAAENALIEKGVELLNERIFRLNSIKDIQGELSPLQAKELANLEAQVKLARIKNPSPEQQRALVVNTRNVADAYNLQIIAMKEALGVASEQEIQAAKTIAIQKALSQGLISSLEAERAATIAAKEAREKYEAQIVRASSLPGLQRQALDLNNVAKQLDQFGSKALETFSDNMADAILGTKTFADAFKAMTNIILKEMIKISIQKALIGPLLGGLTGIVPLAGRMAGGPVMSGTPYIVGERGPEIMVPNTNGNILPNSALQRSGQSIIYSPNIDARGASVEAVARLAQIVEQDRAAFATKTIATIQQARRGRVPGL